MAGFRMHRRSCCWCFVPFLLCSKLLVVRGAFSTLFRQRQQSSTSPLLFSRATADHNSGEDPVSLTTTRNVPTEEKAPQETITDHLKPTKVPNWKRSLPDPLCSRPYLERIDLRTTTSHELSPLDDDDPVFAHVYLLGTAHTSNLSCQDVRMLLEHVDPDVVFLEMCPQRMASLLANTPSHFSNVTSDTDDDISSQANPNKFDLFCKQVEIFQQEGYSFGLSVYLTRLATGMREVADENGVEVAGEFRAAYQYSLEKAEQLREQRRNIHVVLGDRPDHLTWGRAWGSLNWWGRRRLFFFNLWKSLSDDSDKNMGEVINSIILSGESDRQKRHRAELKKHFPTWAAAIVDERDAYMACKLYQVAKYYTMEKWWDDIAQRLWPTANTSQVDRNKRLTMVAIVGAAHVEGMTKWFSDGKIKQQPEEVLRELIRTKSVRPKKKKRWWQRLWSKKDNAPQQQQQLADQGEDSLSEEESFLVEGHVSLQLL